MSHCAIRCRLYERGVTLPCRLDFNLMTSCSRYRPALHCATCRHKYAPLRLTLLAIVAGDVTGHSQVSQAPPDNVILITLDGARIEEMFGGMQVGILQSTLREGQKVEDSPIYRRFWAESPEARREKLMPFFWKHVDGGARLDRREPGARQLGTAGQPSSLLVSGLFRDSPRRGARRRHQEQRSVSQSVHDRARSDARTPSSGPRAGRHRRLMGALQRHRRAYRRGNVRQCGPGAAGRPPIISC